MLEAFPFHVSLQHCFMFTDEHLAAFRETDNGTTSFVFPGENDKTLKKVISRNLFSHKSV
jgi:hypothetical protein